MFSVLHSITYIYTKCIDYKNDSSYILNIFSKNNARINSEKKNHDRKGRRIMTDHKQYIVTLTLIVLSLFAQCKIFNLNNTDNLNHVLIGTT